MAYDPRPVEPSIYKRWLEAGVFQPRPDAEPYVIVIPPPNVTDVLHVGHALNNTIKTGNLGRNNWTMVSAIRWYQIA